MKPTRIQLSRQAGWRMPENTVIVDRRTDWGNPFVVGFDGATLEDCLVSYEAHAKQLDLVPLLGKNLACWCPLDKPCHADILLRLANGWDSATPARPLLRYHGGKWLLAPWIIDHFPQHRIYVEPYGGAASVLLRKPRSFAEVYNELDQEITELFRIVRERGSELVQALELTPFSREEFVHGYQPTDDPLERCRRTIVRSFQGFGSDGVHSSHRTGFRSCSNRSGTTPAHDWRNYPAALATIIERLQGVIIESRDALEVIRKHDGPQTLFYVDPPYLHATRQRTDAARGYRHEMTDDDHRALASVLNQVAGAVVLSGYPSPLYDELFRGWQRVERTGPFADGARERTEVLWLRNVDMGLFTLAERKEVAA